MPHPTDFPLVAVNTVHTPSISQFRATIYNIRDVNGNEMLGDYDYLYARYQPWPPEYGGGIFIVDMRDNEHENNPAPLAQRHDQTRQWMTQAYNDLKLQLVGAGLVVDESNSFALVNPPDAGQVEAYPPTVLETPETQWNTSRRYDRWQFRTYETEAVALFAAAIGMTMQFAMQQYPAGRENL